MKTFKKIKMQLSFFSPCMFGIAIFSSITRFCAPHVFWSLRTPARTQFRTSGVLIMRNFLKRADRVTHRKLPSGPVPEQGRQSYSCNLGSEPDIFVNCNCSCAEVVQNRVQMSGVRLKPL